MNDTPGFTSLMPDDIDDQGVFNNSLGTINTLNNYGYDELGNLVRDNQEQIASIGWNVYGKMTGIRRTAGSTRKDMDFVYDAMGNRIEKRVYAPGSVQKFWEHEYYVRDAQGNVMAVYNYKPVFVNGITKHKELNLSEHAVYGSSRLGRQRYEAGENADAFYSPMSTANGNYVLSLKKGLREYELNNHLGNVLSVVSDRKLPRTKALAPTVVHEYVGEVLGSSDYAAFGAMLDGRVFNGGNMRYGFNGKENDNEIKGTGNSVDFGARINDPRLGRWLSVDPFAKLFLDLSPYSSAGNNPIYFIDPTGGVILPWFSDPKYSKQFSTVLEVANKGKIFKALYKYLDGVNNLKKFSMDGKTTPIPGTPALFITDALLTQDEKKGIEGGNANFSEATINQLSNKKLQHDKQTYYVGTHINIDQNHGFTFSTLYEEIFHAGQKTFYLINNIQVNNLTLEVEAKLSKIQSFFNANSNLSASDMKAEMQKNGFFQYEIDFLISGGEYVKSVVSYLKGNSLTVTTMSEAYNEVVNFGEAIRNEYKEINKAITKEVLNTEFKFNSKLQKDADTK